MITEETKAFVDAIMNRPKTQGAIKSQEAAARIRAILREYLGPELPDVVTIWDTGGVEKGPGIRWRGDFMTIELKADKDK